MRRATRRRRDVGIILLTVALVLLCPVAQAMAQSDDPAGAAPRVSLWQLVQSGGMVGYCILLMSLVATALVIEHFLSIRRETLLPRQLEADLEQAITAGDLPRARDLCASDGSLLARIVDTGLANANSMFGFLDMQNAMQEVSERHVGALYRKLEYLSFIATTAPMLGLLGTVTGMIASFNTISLTEGAASPAQLAGGISEALVTTCMGLILAIPATFFVSLFRNRVETYVAEAESVVERLMGRFRSASAAR